MISISYESQSQWMLCMFPSHSRVSPYYFYCSHELFLYLQDIFLGFFFVKRVTTLVSGFHSGGHVMEDSQGERIVPAGVEGGTDGPGLLFGLIFGVRGELELDIGV